MTAEELQKRHKAFAYHAVPLCKSPSRKKNSKIIEDQLSRSAFSAVTSYRAVFRDQWNKAFKSGLRFAFERIDGSLPRLRIANGPKPISMEKMALIMKEADELSRILAAARMKPEMKTQALLTNQS